MDRLRRSFRESFRRRKDRIPESSKPHQWQADESAVRAGTCTFAVKYLGCVEVFDSRGMQVCEEALKVLRGSRRRPVRAVLHVSGDGLRVVEEETKGLIVDQTIEKVSFCAPDRNHERGFSYICRDGTTRRWMCHGFLALRGVGGAAVARRRLRLRRLPGAQAEAGQGAAGADGAGVDVGPPKPPPVNPFAIERPHATPSMLQRQGSCRGFSTLGQNSPFKRQMSLRVNELPSNTARLNSYKSPTSPTNSNGKPPVSPIPEVSPGDSVTALCQQLSQGLSQLTHSGSDDFNFNNQSSVNQNTLNLNVTTINNTYNRSTMSTPATTTTAIAPVSLSFSPSASRTDTPVKSRSQNTSISSTTSTLPKPEQWLEIVNSTSPTPVALPRAVSLDSGSENFQNVKNGDPFDAEWAEIAARQNNSTNPFLATATPKAFQIQL
ncbi:hypothetical protein NQ318_007021 [Aromia moschata]|uniref:PID domain-containing protein n=1 Tax=Aromia moschata TaxID=1265417 RepID=A0AAV8Y1V6_9CUCU|nr:hypothetical protein NQ318_007021 [Aromia moschata]